MGISNSRNPACRAMKREGNSIKSIQADPHHQSSSAGGRRATYSGDSRIPPDARNGTPARAPHMQEVEGFDKRDYPLHAAAIAECEGFVFVNIDDDPQPFADWFAPMLQRLTRFDLARLRVGHSVTYDVHANWELVFQNYSEC